MQPTSKQVLIDQWLRCGLNLVVQEFEAKSGPLPPGLFSHNVMVRSAETVHAQDAAAKGVLGKIADALSSQEPAYSTGTYSTSGNAAVFAYWS